MRVGAVLKVIASKNFSIYQIPLRRNNISNGGNPSECDKVAARYRPKNEHQNASISVKHNWIKYVASERDYRIYSTIKRLHLYDTSRFIKFKSGIL